MSFVLLLVAIIELTLPETVVLCAAMGAMQSLWKPARRPPSYQVLFNMLSLVLSGTAAYLVCRWFAAYFCPPRRRSCCGWR